MGYIIGCLRLSSYLFLADDDNVDIKPYNNECVGFRSPHLRVGFLIFDVQRTPPLGLQTLPRADSKMPGRTLTSSKPLLSDLPFSSSFWKGVLQAVNGSVAFHASHTINESESYNALQSY